MGYSKALNQEDLWDLASRDQAAKVSADFQDCLNSDPHKGVIVRAMWQDFGRPFVRAGIIKLIHDLIMFTGEAPCMPKGGKTESRQQIFHLIIPS